MKTRFERKSERINTKKRKITEEIMADVCDKKTKLNKKSLEKKLLKYAKQMVKLEKKKYNIHKRVSLIKTERKDINGSLSYHSGIRLHKEKETGNVTLETGPTLRLKTKNIVELLKSNDSQVRTTAFVGYIQTIHHEMTHLEQHIATENVKKIDDIDSDYALKYAREFAAIKYLGDDYYHEGDNYKKQFIEKNAREKGFEDAIDIFGKNKIREVKINEALKENIDNNLNDIFVETDYLEYNGYMGDRDYITSSLVDEAIANNPKYLKKYPILKKEYNKDGSRKEVYQIIKDKAKAIERIKANPYYSSKKKEQKIIETQNMYCSIFINSLDNATDKDFIKAEKMVGARAIKAMYSNTQEYCQTRAKKLIDDANSEREIRKKIYNKSIKENGNNINSRMQSEKLIHEIEKLYNERVEAIQYKYGSEIEQAKNGENFFRNGGYGNKRLPKSKADEITKKDKIRVENNYNRKKRNKKQVSFSRNVKRENNVVFNLEEIKNLNDDYTKLKEQEQTKLQSYKNEYQYLKAKNEVNIEYVNKNKEDIIRQ